MVTLSLRRCLVAATCLFAAVNGLILLEDIDELTGKTWAAISVLESPIIAKAPPSSQHPVCSAKTPVAIAINDLNKDLAQRLSIPMGDIDIPNPSCSSIGRSYVDFMTQTTRLLVLLQERKPNPSALPRECDDDGDIFPEIEWMQVLWASRTAKGNAQNLSFIEQRQTLYRTTGCFPDMKKVLRRDVEVVELLNDVIDAYDPMNGARQELVK